MLRATCYVHEHHVVLLLWSCQLLQPQLLQHRLLLDQQFLLRQQRRCHKRHFRRHRTSTRCGQASPIRVDDHKGASEALNGQSPRTDRANKRGRGGAAGETATNSCPHNMLLKHMLSANDTVPASHQGSVHGTRCIHCISQFASWHTDEHVGEACIARVRPRRDACSVYNVQCTMYPAWSTVWMARPAWAMANVCLSSLQSTIGSLRARLQLCS